MPDEPQLGPCLVLRPLEMNGFVASGDEAGIEFVNVRSTFYLDLAEHYERQVRAWVLQGSDATA